MFINLTLRQISSWKTLLKAFFFGAGLTACFFLHDRMFNRRLDVSEWEKIQSKSCRINRSIALSEDLCVTMFQGPISSICLFANIILGLPFALLPKELKPLLRFFSRKSNESLSKLNSPLRTAQRSFWLFDFGSETPSVSTRYPVGLTCLSWHFG